MKQKMKFYFQCGFLSIAVALAIASIPIAFICSVHDAVPFAQIGAGLALISRVFR